MYARKALDILKTNPNHSYSGVYKIVEPTEDQRAFDLLCPPLPLRFIELFDDEEYGDEYEV